MTPSCHAQVCSPDAKVWREPGDLSFHPSLLCNLEKAPHLSESLLLRSLQTLRTLQLSTDTLSPPPRGLPLPLPFLTCSVQPLLLSSNCFLTLGTYGLRPALPSDSSSPDLWDLSRWPGWFCPMNLL